MRAVRLCEWQNGWVTRVAKVRVPTSSVASLLILLGVIICALGVVAAQHKARQLFAELQKEKDRAQQMEVEWGQLQLEQSTWAMAARVEKIAATKLQMHSPQMRSAKGGQKGGQIQFVPLDHARDERGGMQP